MRKITKETFDDNNNNEKVAFNIPINPASIIGSVTGSLVARKRLADQSKREKDAVGPTSMLQGNYYSQIENIVNSLKIIFTPFGVIYVLKEGPKEVTIETISTDEMDSSMFERWQRKDIDFFKKMLLNKMHGEIQFVEQQFAKNILQRHLGLTGNITKQASYGAPDDMPFIELLDGVAQMKDVYSKNTPLTEKLAEVLCDSLPGEDLHVSFRFDRPLEKYAFVGNPLSFLGLGIGSSDIRALQGKFLNPSFLSNRVKVAFFPDRVLFSVSDKVVSSLLAIDMNEDGFKKFQEQDSKYFEELFKLEARRGSLVFKGKLPPNSKIIEEDKKKRTLTKTASSDSTIFTRSDIHPAVYFYILNKKYKNRWLEWEVNSLIKIMEDDFDIKEGISDVPLNKIMCIHSGNNNLYPYENPLVFEKVIRSFSNRPIDFLSNEENISAFDIAFGIDVLDTVTPNDDIYDNFSPEVFSYIIRILIENEVMVFMPSLLLESKLKDAFYKELNERLLDAITRRDIVNIDNLKLESKTVKNNEIIFYKTKELLENIRSGKKVDVEAELKPYGEVIADNVSRLIILNTKIDGMLVKSSELLKEQLELLEGRDG